MTRRIIDACWQPISLAMWNRMMPAQRRDVAALGKWFVSYSEHTERAAVPAPLLFLLPPDH